MNHFLRSIIAFFIICMFQTVTAQSRQNIVENNRYQSQVPVNGNKVNIAAEDEDWRSLGMGKYRDDYITKIYIVDCYEFDVEIQESKKTPGLYRIVSPYKSYPTNPTEMESDTYMIINATDPEHVFISEHYTGMDWGMGEFVIYSIAGDYYENIYGSLEEAIKEGLCGTLKDGIITFPRKTLLIREGRENLGSYQLANSSGKFRVVLPDAPQLDINIKINGKVEKYDKSYISVNFSIGSDCEKVRIAMIDGDYTSSMATDIVSGSISSIEITESSEQLFLYEEDRVVTFVAVPYYKGIAKDPVYITEELSYNHTGWRKLGQAHYTEGIISGNEIDFEIEAEEYLVDIQESIDNPGYFRLVDPYGLNYSYSSAENYDTSHRYYMEIDATDPDCVSIKQMEKGCGLNFGYGAMIIWSRADRDLLAGKTKEEVNASGLFGKLDNLVITFPESSLLIKFPAVLDTWYWANENSDFKVVLPKGTGINHINLDNANTPVEYFNLQGMKVNAGNLVSGIYIMRQGLKCSKIVIK